MKKLLLLTALLIITACTTIDQNNGAEIHQVKLDQINAASTKNDVYNLLGSPSTKSVYGDDTWYYITSKMRRQLIRDDQVLNQNVLAISYEKGSDKVSNVELYDMKDRREFAEESQVTPTAGKKLSMVEQLLSNVGKFNDAGGNNPIASRSGTNGRY